MLKTRKDIGRKWGCAGIALVLLGMGGVVCLGQGNDNGAAGQMPAYYDDVLFTVNMKEMPNSDPLIEHNKSINEIYATNDLDEEQDFIPVIDAIQGDGFNPLWRQILIVYNVTPFQLTSDTEVDEAADLGLITLCETDEVYRCSVVGPGPKQVEE